MDQPAITTTPFTPLGNIAVTISGGGFRAAAFGLGALSYLDRIGCGGKETPAQTESLLNNVTYISSTSGGSFTNALYSTYIHKGKSFDEVYQKLLQSMTGQELLQRVFEVMDDDKQWNQPGNEKQRNFINAFSKVYDSFIFEEETMGVFWNKNHVQHFEVCFNCTEFYRGQSFRFQTEGTDNPFQVVGNKYLFFDAPHHIETVKKLKIADMVAASSCFPGGFEPIVYPQDFTYANKAQQLDSAALKQALLFEDYQEIIKPIEGPYGFMDGGITDNQGLNSAMVADRKRRARKQPTPFDTIMVTDVTSYFMDEYKLPEELNTPVIRTRNINFFIGKIRAIVKTIASAAVWPLVVSALLLAAGISLVAFCDSTALRISGAFISGIALVFLILLIVVKKLAPVQWVLKNKTAITEESTITDWIQQQKFMSPKMLQGLVHFLRVTKLGMLEQMVKARLASVISLMMDINLKQTRRLIYDLFYADPLWENRRVPNFIYTLSTNNVTSRTNRLNNPGRLGWTSTTQDRDILLGNCNTLNQVAEEARTMGTTLWFTEKDEQDMKLKKIIATGQFTTCCNLVEYLISLERKQVQLDPATAAKLQLLKAKLVQDFERFKTEPYFLYDLFYATLKTVTV